MNERIRELMSQAGFDPAAIERMGVMPQAEKFAELIVKECVAQCWSVSELEHKGYAVSECSKRIRKYFGVEE